MSSLIESFLTSGIPIDGRLVFVMMNDVTTPRSPRAIDAADTTHATHAAHAARATLVRIGVALLVLVGVVFHVFPQRTGIRVPFHAARNLTSVRFL